MDTPNPYQPPSSKSSNDKNFESNQPERKDDKLIVLATFIDATEAYILRFALENAGIKASIANENSAQTVGGSWLGRTNVVWIEVLVFESDTEKALQIKNNYLDNEAQLEIPEWTCKCGESVDAGFAICWSCSAEYAA